MCRCFKTESISSEVIHSGTKSFVLRWCCEVSVRERTTVLPHRSPGCHQMLLDRRRSGDSYAKKTRAVFEGAATNIRTENTHLSLIFSLCSEKNYNP